MKLATIINEGDRVKIIAGTTYVGETGTVVKVKKMVQVKRDSTGTVAWKAKENVEVLEDNDENVGAVAVIQDISTNSTKVKLILKTKYHKSKDQFKAAVEETFGPLQKISINYGAMVVYLYFVDQDHARSCVDNCTTLDVDGARIELQASFLEDARNPNEQRYKRSAKHAPDNGDVAHSTVKQRYKRSAVPTPEKSMAKRCGRW